MISPPPSKRASKLDTLQRTLAERGQLLAVDPPLPDRATVGGTLATAASGPLRWQYGHVRDLVIGLKVVQADGTSTKSGGEVVKNVSGYDMARLHIGALGTLGVITEVSFKLTPLPRRQASVLAAFDSFGPAAEAALSVFHGHVAPLAVTLFGPRAVLRLGLDGADGKALLAVRVGGRTRTLERQIRSAMTFPRAVGPSRSRLSTTRPPGRCGVPPPTSGGTTRPGFPSRPPPQSFPPPFRTRSKPSSAGATELRSSPQSSPIRRMERSTCAGPSRAIRRRRRDGPRAARHEGRGPASRRQPARRTLPPARQEASGCLG